MLIRSITVLTLGAGLAQGIALAVLPLLTRLYGPADFAILTVFVTVVSTILPFVCGKYETAIVVAGEERHARELASLCIWLSGALSVGMACVAILFERSINDWLGCPRLGAWLVAAAAAVWLNAIVMVCSNLANRRLAFGWIAKSSILQAVAAALINVAMGLLGAGAAGLLLASLASILLSTAFLVTANRPDLSSCFQVGWRSMREVAYRYRDFPIYNASSSVFNALALAMPVFFLSRLCGAETVGFFGLLMRVAWAPLSLLSGAVSQVHLNRVSECVRSGRSVAPYLLRLAAGLAAIALPLTLLVVGWGPDLFSFLFGTRWQMAGEYLGMMMPAIAMQFIASTLSTTCCATGNNRLAAAWKVLAFCVTLTFFVLVAPSQDTRAILQSFAVINTVLYLMYFVVIVHCARHPRMPYQG